MNQPLNTVFLAAPSFALVALVLQGCSVPTSTVDLTPAPDEVEFTITPNVIPSGATALVKVVSPSADSISIESPNGFDRFWGIGPTLETRIGSEFGDTMPGLEYAIRERGQLFDIVKKPIKVVVCRRNDCREFYRELAVRLPERNERSVAITGGWSSAFTRRAV